MRKDDVFDINACQAGGISQNRVPFSRASFPSMWYYLLHEEKASQIFFKLPHTHCHSNLNTNPPIKQIPYTDPMRGDRVRLRGHLLGERRRQAVRLRDQLPESHVL